MHSDTILTGVRLYFVQSFVQSAIIGLFAGIEFRCFPVLPVLVPCTNGQLRSLSRIGTLRGYVTIYLRACDKFEQPGLKFLR